MKVLYISFYFAPYNHIAAIRATKLCKYLHRMEQDIRVISAKDQLLPQDLPIEFPREKIIYADWKNINTPFKKFFGKQKHVADNRSYLSAGQKKKPLIKKLVKVYKSCLYFPDDKIGWIWPAFSRIKELLKNWKPDIIYISGGPFSGFILGSLLHRKYRIPWIAEYRDLWTQGHQYPYRKFRRGIEKQLENRAVSSAERFVTVSEPLARQLRDRFGKKVHVINNAFDEEDRKGLSQSISSFQKGKFHIVYTGQIYIDRQNPASLFRALEKNQLLRQKVVVHFYGPNLKEKIERKFDADLLKKLRSNLKFYGLVSHNKAMQAQEAADSLLLLGWTDQKFGGVLTGKLFEYLGAKRPILSLNNHADDASQFVVDNNVGFLCHNSCEITAKLCELIKIKDQDGEIKSLSSEVQSFSYPAKTNQLLGILKETLC